GQLEVAVGTAEQDRAERVDRDAVPLRAGERERESGERDVAHTAAGRRRVASTPAAAAASRAAPSAATAGQLRTDVRFPAERQVLDAVAVAVRREPDRAAGEVEQVLVRDRALVQREHRDVALG